MLLTKPGVTIMGNIGGDLDEKQLYDEICMAQFNNQPLVSSLFIFQSYLNTVLAGRWR